MDAVKAIGAVALLTIEVGMKIVKVLPVFAAMAFRRTYGIFYGTRAVVDGMD